MDTKQPSFADTLQYMVNCNHWLNEYLEGRATAERAMDTLKVIEEHCNTLRGLLIADKFGKEKDNKLNAALLKRANIKNEVTTEQKKPPLKKRGRPKKL